MPAHGLPDSEVLGNGENAANADNDNEEVKAIFEGQM